MHEIHENLNRTEITNHMVCYCYPLCVMQIAVIYYPNTAADSNENNTNSVMSELSIANFK